MATFRASVTQADQIGFSIPLSLIGFGLHIFPVSRIGRTLLQTNNRRSCTVSDDTPYGQRMLMKDG